MFIANPASVPSDGCVYAHPDGSPDGGKTWRQLLVDYNNHTENKLGLRRAYALYRHPVYKELVDQYGVDNVFILSAGWGLISAKFLTPDYDITFSNMKKEEKYKQRRSRDLYHDLCQLPADAEDDLVFLGGKGYLPLFCKLTAPIGGAGTCSTNRTVNPIRRVVN